ncbi:protein kinase family protein [Nocardiopsis deserti]|uniref:protein kinase family protein n=1 Tax=Nocardiopsis deserti TaxID=2605988 RepID=UPI00123A028F|nr:protein kinase family protein [Nocardiopsis deserti]
MSTFLIEPGAKLANRYRLDQVVSETGGATRWKATDETLARPVAVWTFAEGFPRTSEVVRAARATSRIPDARVTQVFDADDSSPVPYVVEEWVIGSSLTDLLAQGPMEPERAAGLVAEAAEAIAAAHAGGLHHLCLTPSKLMWSSGGAVKVTGIGVDAALLGAGNPDPAATDAQGLGNLLYAALTGHWPGGPQSGLPAAPEGPAGPYPPHHIRQGVTEPLGTITTRAALPQLAGQLVPGPPITSPADFCAAMAEVPRLIPLPVTQAESAPPVPGTSRRTGEFDSTGPRRGARNSRGGGASAREDQESRHGSVGRAGSASRGGASVRGGSEIRERSAPSRMEQRTARTQPSLRKILIGVAALVLFAGVVVGAWTVGTMFSSGGSEEAPPEGGGEQASDDGGQVELSPLEIQGARGLNPHGNTDEHSDKAGRAHDGDPTTEWNTQGYRDPLSDIKPGVGLQLDLGAVHEVHEVDLNLGGSGYEFQILAGESDSDSEDGYEVVGSGEGGSQVVSLDEPVEARYVVVWFTELAGSGEWRGTVYEAEVRGVE